MDTPLNATAAPVCPQNGTAHDGTLLCHWANSPGGRGTLNIFWLCISTLGLCVWNAVHPDIPRPKTPGWRVLGKRVWMLFVGLFMPEMLVLVALGQLRQACNLLVKIDRETAAPTQFPWWMYLLELWRPKRRNPEYETKWWMRALLWCLRVPSTSPVEERHTPASTSDLEEGKIETSPQPVRVDEHSSDHAEKLRSPRATDWGIDAPMSMARQLEALDTSQHVSDSSKPVVYGPPALGCEREHRWTLTHCFYFVMHGFVDKKGDAIDIKFYCIDVPMARKRTLSTDEGNLVDIKSLLMPISRVALPFDNPNNIPDLSIEDIEDRGKAGVLAKSLLVWQLFVFLANCFARWDQSLLLSLLEITTIGHSLCSIITMVLWWYKPHSIGEATVIDRQGPIRSLSNAGWRQLFSLEFLGDSFDAGRDKVMVGDGDMDVPRTLTILAIAVLYGLPHLLGLSVHFPTFAEQLCWEIATFTVIGSPLVICGIVWIVPYVEKLDDRMEDTVQWAVFVLIIILLVLYPIASMFLVGESVRQIFALPVESFREPQQTTYLPSFS